MATDNTNANFPITVAEDGWSTDDEATATCFCGAVQLAFVSPIPSSLSGFPYRRTHALQTATDAIHSQHKAQA